MGKHDELVSDLHQTDSGHPECDQRIRKAATAITTLEAELAAMKVRGDRLAEFSVHRAECARKRIHFTAVSPDCTCGLTQALTEWKTICDYAPVIAENERLRTTGARLLEWWPEGSGNSLAGRNKGSGFADDLEAFRQVLK